MAGTLTYTRIQSTRRFPRTKRNTEVIIKESLQTLIHGEVKYSWITRLRSPPTSLLGQGYVVFT